MRVIGRVVIILVPVLFIFGLLRFAINSFQGNFVPSVEQYITWFENFPDIVGDFNDAINSYNSSTVQCAVTGSGNIFDVIGKMWCDSFGQFSDWFKHTVYLINVILSTPFRVLAWLFSIFII